MTRPKELDPNCASCKKGLEVYYATPHQEYFYEPGIYGFYTFQLNQVNGRAYFKKGNYGIWWDEDHGKWTIGFHSNRGSNTGVACIERDVFCLHSVKEWDWELFWGDTGDWEKARKNLGVKIFYAQDLSCETCKKGVEVYFGTDKQEYSRNIYGHYTIQPQLVNDRAYFKKGDHSIWWDGEDCWMIGSDFQKGSTSGFAVIQKDVFCLHKASELNWQLAWDQGDWREAGNALGVKCSS